MQVTETRSEGLKREYKVVLPADDLASRVESQLNEIKAKARIKGFRPGKVPVAHLRRLYGRSIMAEVMQEAVNDANRKIVEDNALRLAGAPKIDLPKDQDELEKAFESKADLSYVVALEVLPKVEVGSFDDVEIERLVADIPESEIDAAIKTIAERNRPFTPKDGEAVAETGDKVTVDFVGKVGGEEFQGGSAQDIDIVLGSGSFIPGFEDQIIGMKIGEERTVNVTFPEAYSEPTLAGKPAEFAVTLKAVAAPGTLDINDEFAKGLGFDDLEKLRQSMRASLEREASLVSRRKWKRELLDALDRKYSFDLPDELVEQEFSAIWRQAEAELKASGRTLADEGTTEEQERATYRRIAERRVRLGLALAEIGDVAGVKVSDEEVAQALFERARQYPGMEKQFIEFYRNNAERLAEIRGPLFEEKVIDHVLSQSKVTDRHVGKDELLTEVEAAEKAAEDEAQKGLGTAPAAAG
ncbi:trigger factor [uncultured Methylovirgula sp.]|uniref:trigger factor n=1 Tax=uncultured Methylovirgula sp. TaxID=1285960 RepID=UPI0026391070|nr:trigger factor [uncultured Methylovirgula sp.]